MPTFTTLLRARHGATHFAQPLVERFVPAHQPVPDEYIRRIDGLLADKPRVLVLTGAGISTESGIPDYRSAGVGMYNRPEAHRPVQHIEFIRSAATRKRYWARNYVAWPRFSSFRPNATHTSLARFEHARRLGGLITQNVDRLHVAAGSRDPLELHGHSHAVICVGRHDGAGRRVAACDYSVDRAALQIELDRLNAELVRRVCPPPPSTAAEADATGGEFTATLLRPDGDIDVPAGLVEGFAVPACPKCGGSLKPDVVFFGDNVPRDRLERVEQMIEASDALLVCGSSLQILSGYRIVVNAHERGLPVVIVNIGPTRADAVATIKLSARCGDVVPRMRWAEAAVGE